MGPLFLSNTGSFFWRQILKLKSLFHICAQWELLSGKQTSFWFDGWAGQALALQLAGPIQRRAISVFDAKTSFDQLVPRLLTLHFQSACDKIILLLPLQQKDNLIWNLTPSGRFTVNSAYTLLAQGGRTRSQHVSLWKAKEMPSMKLFFFFLLNNRFLAHEVMQKRQLPFTPGCVLCNTATAETTMHLFFTCPLATMIWSGLSSRAEFALLRLHDNPAETYIRSTPGDKGRRVFWRVLFITATWLLWKERNNRIFRHETLPCHILINMIQRDAALCLKFC